MRPICGISTMRRRCRGGCRGCRRCSWHRLSESLRRRDAGAGRLRELRGADARPAGRLREAWNREAWDNGSKGGSAIGETLGMSEPGGSVVSVSGNGVYSFTKPVRDEIVLVAGIGGEGDVRAGVRVRHRSRVKADPTQPNLRQVHLIQGKLFGEVGEKGYTVAPGNLGENVTTSGIDLLSLPTGTILRFGPPEGDAAGEDASAALQGVLVVAAA